MASGDIGSNPAITKIAAQSGGSQIAVKRSSGGDIPIKRSELNVKSAQDIIAEVSPTMEGSLSRIQTLQSDLSEALKSLNQSTSLDFSVDSSSNRFVVRVTEPDSGAVIFEVPSEAILRVARNIESLRGVLFDKEM
jgi:flagellar protein FlaG